MRAVRPQVAAHGWQRRRSDRGWPLAPARVGVMSRKKGKGRLPPFVPLIRTTLASPAWKQLSFGARSLYVVLRSYLRNDYLNNGKVFRSYRDAANDLGTKSIRSVQRWYRELVHYGFIQP